MAYSIYTLRVPRAWLHRLFHVPSTTSREWKPGSIYGKDTDPNSEVRIAGMPWGRNVARTPTDTLLDRKKKVGAFELGTIAVWVSDGFKSEFSSLEMVSSLKPSDSTW